ncbi:F-box/kelch-repeat protein-like protein [Tanacetum coccineum]
MVLFDVTEEVLLRLTVKDVLRCKSVCKSWYSLISSPSFVKLHLKHVCKKEEKNNKQLGNRRIAMISRYVIRVNGFRCYIPDEWEYYSTLNMEGSSNGLVCMSSLDNRICLTNPSTREFRKLHKPPILPTDASCPRLCGFGYDSSTDDYKLVLVINQGSIGSLIQILSLKSNVWKHFGHVNYSFSHDTEPGILFNGALHWIMSNNNRDKAFIVSFNLATEEFKEIAQLDDTRFSGSWYNKLGIFEDHLCIFQQRNGGRPFGIWVMKNYNVKQSSICWELLPTECEMKDRVHYMIHDSLQSRKMPSYFCCDDTFLSRSGKHGWSPIFVQTLVSPYVNNHRRPSDAKKNKMTVEAGSSKIMREIEEVHTLKDGEKNAFHSDEEVETGRKKRKSSKSRKRFFIRSFASVCLAIRSLIISSVEDKSTNIWNFGHDILRDILGHNSLIISSVEDKSTNLWNFGRDILRDILGHNSLPWDHTSACHHSCIFVKRSCHYDCLASLSALSL